MKLLRECSASQNSELRIPFSASPSTPIAFRPCCASVGEIMPSLFTSRVFFKARWNCYTVQPSAPGPWLARICSAMPSGTLASAKAVRHSSSVTMSSPSVSAAEKAALAKELRGRPVLPLLVVQPPQQHFLGCLKWGLGGETGALQGFLQQPQGSMAS